ncbi:SbcC/MukB-like Walker B domain-containing protein [Radiobacillus deserti]|uniref:Nuclease SbcCD subunit C n=1 Tax=Radiobacillus deserti TaxID=2594883 RepID=A0A516KG66_9BACI|nr:SMC family ATPase [Radiobacillus deserti]QDP40398.1 SMC family ATPase [Radiobacillus deserti]
MNNSVKMIMIPQGEFRRLISENSKEREEILQKIFHTYFYDRITEELKKQSKELRNWIEQIEWQLEQEAAKIEWEEPDQEEEPSMERTLERLMESVEKKQNLLIEQQDKFQLEKKTYTELQETFYQAKQRKTQFDEYEQVKQTEQLLLNKKEEMDRTKNTYNLALKAHHLRVFEDQVKQRKHEWNDIVEREKHQMKRQEQVEARFTQVKKEYEEEKNKEADRQKLHDWIKQHQQYLPKLQTYTERKKYKQALQQKIGFLKQKQVKNQAEITHLKENIETLEQRTDAHHEQTKKLYEIDIVYKNWLERITKLKELIHENKQLHQLRSSFSNVKKEYEATQLELQSIKLQIKQEEQRQQYELAYSLALQLQDSEPCPVCGSTHHPSPASVSSKQHDKGKNIEQLVEQQNRLELQLQQIQEKFVNAKSDGQAKRQVVEQYCKQLTVQMEDVTEKQLRTWLEEAEQLAQQEKLNYEQVQQFIKEIEKAKKEREDKQIILQQLHEKTEKEKKELEEYNQQDVAVRTQLQAIEQDLPATILNSSASQLEETIRREQSRYEKWVKHWEEIKQVYEELDNERNQVEATLKELQNFIDEAKNRYETQLQSFLTKVKESGFEDRETYHASLLDEDKMEKLRMELEDYETKKSHITERKLELETLLRDQTYPNLEKLEQEMTAQEQVVEQYRHKLQEIQLFIKQHESISIQLQDLLAKQQNYAKQYYDIAELADLARGENHLKLSFERYVLSSFLDEILMQANLRLDQMTEHRYHLQRSDQVAKRGAQSGLDLEVMDHHTGQVRSVKTLSGGEGFKTALSLALGLADVVQAHAGGVQLDTLFIDEGFGTLDEVSLAQAIDCLKGLQQSNRVLGIISHVPQLKEEIHAKLQISTSPEGSKVAFQFH